MPKSQEIGEGEVLSRSKQMFGLNTWGYEQCGTNPREYVWVVHHWERAGGVNSLPNQSSGENIISRNLS